MTALDKRIAEGWRRHTTEPEQVAAVIEGIDLAGNGGDLDASHAIRANLPAEDQQYCTLPQGMDS